MEVLHQSLNLIGRSNSEIKFHHPSFDIGWWEKNSNQLRVLTSEPMQTMLACVCVCFGPTTLVTISHVIFSEAILCIFLTQDAICLQVFVLLCTLIYIFGEYALVRTLYRRIVLYIYMK